MSSQYIETFNCECLFLYCQEPGRKEDFKWVKRIISAQISIECDAERKKQMANVKTETQSVNILKYCYGFEDNWTMKGEWFYYKKPFEEGESVEICRGFNFPDEWRFRESNILGITVVAEAVADEPEEHAVKTGDESKILFIFMMATMSLCMIMMLAGRRE